MAETLNANPHWRVSSPQTVDDDLGALWREVAREGPISRAMMSNLVIMRPPRESTGDLHVFAEGTIVTGIVRRHPARTLLLDYTSGATRPCAPDAISVGVFVFRPSGGRYGVELIAIHAACAEASLPSIVRRLTHGDVPTSLCWRGDLSEQLAPSPLIDSGRQFVYDSGFWRDLRAGFRAITDVLSRRHVPDLADLNWRRVSPIRHAIVQAFGRPELVPPAIQAARLEPGDVQIRYRGDHGAKAWLLAGWLTSKMKWTPAHGVLRMEELDHDREFLAATFRHGDFTLRVSMSETCVKVESSAVAVPLLIPVPPETEVDGVVAELRNLGRDARLREAVLAIAGRP
jgi:glucose-6-phosphate dehydrogenase assembly protein OpcA